jgi:hypothetical protein
VAAAIAGHSDCFLCGSPRLPEVPAPHVSPSQCVEIDRLEEQMDAAIPTSRQPLFQDARRLVPLTVHQPPKTEAALG